MRELLSHVTALLLAAHTVFGCCWHHAHACTGGCERQYPSGWESTNTLEKSLVCDGDCRSDGQKHEPQACKELSCVFIGPLSMKVVESDRSALPTVFLPMPQGCFSPDVTIAGGSSRIISNLPPPIRINLLHQILLI